MKLAKFTRCADPTDLDTLKGWFGANYDYNDRCPAMFCITMHAIADFTQQEMDDLSANAASKFMEVTFE